MIGAKLVLAGLVGLGAVAFAVSGKKSSPGGSSPGGGAAPGGGTPFPGTTPGGGVPSVPGGGVPGMPGGAPGTVPGGFQVPPGLGGLGGIVPPGLIPGLGGAPGNPAAPPGSIPTTPVPEGQGVIVQSQDGTMQLNPAMKDQALQALQFQKATPSNQQIATAPGAIVVATGFGTGAQAWVNQQTGMGRSVITNMTPENMVPTAMASVLPVQVPIACRRGSGWVLAFEPSSTPGQGQQPSTPTGPYDPANYPGDYPMPPGGGGTVPADYFPGGSAPFFPPGLFPGGSAPPGMPGGTPAAPAPAPGGGGYKHVLRQGDTAGSMAYWYTGNAGRWKELQQVNSPLRFVYMGSTPVAYQNVDWQPPRVLNLPTGWDGSKGPGPVNAGMQSAPPTFTDSTQPDGA